MKLAGVRAKHSSKRVSERVNRLDASVETEKEKDDFLTGVPAIADAIRSGKIQFRVYRKERFHAKAYITHARLEVIGSAGVGRFVELYTPRANPKYRT